MTLCSLGLYKNIPAFHGLDQCWYNVGPSFATLAQHYTSPGSTSRRLVEVHFPSPGVLAGHTLERTHGGGEISAEVVVRCKACCGFADQRIWLESRRAVR